MPESIFMRQKLHKGFSAFYFDFFREHAETVWETACEKQKKGYRKDEHNVTPEKEF